MILSITYCLSSIIGILLFFYYAFRNTLEEKIEKTTNKIIRAEERYFLYSRAYDIYHYAQFRETRDRWFAEICWNKSNLNNLQRQKYIKDELEKLKKC